MGKLEDNSDLLAALVQGETYSYSATATGYVGATGSFTPDADTKTVAVTLTTSGGGTGGPGSGGDTSYTITGYTGANGKVTPNKTSAKAGETITLTVAPAAGYGLASLSVSGATIAPAVSSNVSNYTFTIPSGNATLTAAFDKIVLTLNSQKSTSAISIPFTDVQVSDWFYDAVSFAYEQKLFSGVSDTEFAPNAAMTRAMLVTVLYRFESNPQVDEGSQFTDVSDSAEYFYNPVVWASGNGIVGGYSYEYFGAGDNITREQMVTILYRYAQYKKYDVSQSDNLSSFTDSATVSDWAQSAMQWAVAAGIVSGSDGGLSPQDFATRAQVAVILQRFIEKYE